MHIAEFESGRWIKATGYRYFLPIKVNRQWEHNDPQVNTLLERASLKLGELNSYARLVPNVDLFIQLHVTKEALVSSRIEGTQTTMEEALLSVEDLKEERRDDWQEVKNYVMAMNRCIADLNELPLSSRMLRSAHAILLSGVRGQHKQPGNFRRSQNWIGGASLADAVFIPPAHAYVNEWMGDLENFLHNEDIHVPALIRIAIAHYQFETIHPFLDGNGRIGRLLITLYLVAEGLLNRPLLYLSSFFEQDRQLYYDNLTRVRDKGDMMRWIKYFLVGVEQTATQGVSILEKVVNLKARNEQVIQQEMGRRVGNAMRLHQHLLQQPMVTVRDVQRVCELSPKAAIDMMTAFEERAILKQVKGHGRKKIFTYEQYVALFK